MKEVGMMKEILDFIKTLIEKYGFRSVIAFIITIILITYTPATIISLLQFGDNNKYWLMALYFATLIVLETGVLFLCRKVKSKISYAKYEQESIKTNNKKALEDLWTFVDGLSETARNEIREFLKTNNTPIPKRHFHSNDLYSNYSALLVTIEKQTEIEEKVTYADTGKEGILTAHSTHIYKLKDEVYELIKYSHENYGKICHFE